MRVEEEAEARTEVIYIHATAARPFHILNAVIDGEGQLLQGGRTRLADVVSTDRNRVEFGREA